MLKTMPPFQGFKCAALNIFHYL